MSKGFLVIFGSGLVVIALVVGMVFYAKRGEHLEPKGSVIKARTQEMEDKRSLLVLDVRLVNDSDVTMVVRSITLTAVAADGNSVDGMTLGATDLRSIFKDYRLLGEQYTEALAEEGKIPPRSTVDRTVAAAFDMRIADMEGRKKVTVKVEGAGGVIAELSGK